MLRVPTLGGARTSIFTAPMPAELEVTTDDVVGQILPSSMGKIWIESADGAVLHTTANDPGYCPEPIWPVGQGAPDMRNIHKRSRH